jgi:hypothetical protein
MSALREKIIRALLENAFLSCFEYYYQCPGEAADNIHDAEKGAIDIFIPDGTNGNGTMRRLRQQFYNAYAQRRRERLAEYE